MKVKRKFLKKTKRELRKIAKKKEKQAKINSKKYKFKGEIIPQTEYTMSGDKYVIDLANELGVPLYCIKKANPTKDLDTLRLGETIVIPERKSVAGLSIKTSADVANATGFSENFIEILQYNEGWNEKPYWDKVRYSVGYGHSGRILGKYIEGEKDASSLIIMTKKNVDKISLSEEDANEILAQDLLIRIAEAEARFGEDFNCAPKSLQAGIVDIIFNAGVERGFEGDKTKNIESNLKYADYTSAVKNLLIYPNNPESYKRNCYRIILALEDFSREDRIEVLNDPEIKSYFDMVKNYLVGKKLPQEAKMIDEKCQSLLNN